MKGIIKHYSLEDMYNANEMALFYKLMPSKTFGGKWCPGGKNLKERITVLLCVDLSGMAKLKSLVIGK